MPKRSSAAGERAGASGGDLRERLLAAAWEEVARVGADDISLRALARKVGVSHQAPLHVFGSRRGLLTALATAAVNHLTEEIARAARAAEAEGGGGVEAVLAIGVKYIEVALSEQGLFALATRAEVLDLADAGLREARANAWAVLYDAVGRAQEQGWRTGQPTDLLALTCWSLVQGLAVIHRDRLAPEELADRTPEELARAVAALF